MTELNDQIDAAIAAQGRRRDETPSAAILTLLTELARAGRIADLARAYERFRRAHPGAARHVEPRIPAKVVNHHFYLNLELPGGAIQAWQKANADWSSGICDQLGNPAGFAAYVDRLARVIRGSRST